MASQSLRACEGTVEYDRQVPDLTDQARESFYLTLENRVTRARSLLSERSDLESANG